MQSDESNSAWQPRILKYSVAARREWLLLAGRLSVLMKIREPKRTWEASTVFSEVPAILNCGQEKGNAD